MNTKLLKKSTTICVEIKVERTKSLDERIAGSGGNAAVVVPIARHADIAFFTPALAPAVLDEPVLLAGLAVGAVADR